MKNMHVFQFTCVGIAFLSWLLLTYSGKNVVTVVDRTEADRATLENGNFCLYSTYLLLLLLLW